MSDLGIDAGRHTFNADHLSGNDPPLSCTIGSVASLSKDTEEGRFWSLLLAFTLLTSPFLH